MTNDSYSLFEELLRSIHIPVLATWHIRVRRFGACEIALEG